MGLGNYYMRFRVVLTGICVYATMRLVRVSESLRCSRPDGPDLSATVTTRMLSCEVGWAGYR